VVGVVEDIMVQVRPEWTVEEMEHPKVTVSPVQQIPVAEEAEVNYFTEAALVMREEMGVLVLLLSAIRLVTKF
jgi:hypothetical protein